jgi:TPR repeat protein
MRFKEWELLAKEEVSEAQYNLGLIYSIGKEVLKDEKEAVKWFKLAAEKGFAQAQNNLGLMYGKGDRVLRKIFRKLYSGSLYPQDKGMLKPNII